jgi:hypothetical protein
MTNGNLKERINALLTQYEGSLGNTHGDLTVPVGVVRSIQQILPEYEFVANETTRRNIAYAVEALDFFRWLINRFSTYGPVRGYQYKVGLVLVDMILEGITRDFLSQCGIRPANKHSKNIPKLDRANVPEELIRRIKGVHDRRSNIHLHLVSDLEATKYTMKDWNAAIVCLHQVKSTFPRVLPPF